jgi:hypothetical protein
VNKRCIPVILFLFIIETILLIMNFNTAQAKDKTVFTNGGIEFKGNRVIANFKNVALKDVLDSFKSAKKVSYRGDRLLLNMKVSKTLENATVEEALKRILFNFDHVLIYDADSQVSQVLVINKSDDIGNIEKLIFIDCDGLDSTAHGNYQNRRGGSAMRDSKITRAHEKSSPKKKSKRQPGPPNLPDSDHVHLPDNYPVSFY